MGPNSLKTHVRGITFLVKKLWTPWIPSEYPIPLVRSKIDWVEFVMIEKLVGPCWRQHYWLIRKIEKTACQFLRLRAFRNKSRLEHFFEQIEIPKSSGNYQDWRMRWLTYRMLVGGGGGNQEIVSFHLCVRAVWSPGVIRSPKVAAPFPFVPFPFAPSSCPLSLERQAVFLPP